MLGGGRGGGVQEEAGPEPGGGGGARGLRPEESPSPLGRVGGAGRAWPGSQLFEASLQLFPLSIMISISIHFPANAIISFFLMAE
jgi:hypothetical protein